MCAVGGGQLEMLRAGGQAGRQAGGREDVRSDEVGR